MRSARRCKLTHGDRFVELPGYKTFTSHYHMAARRPCDGRASKGNRAAASRPNMSA